MNTNPEMPEEIKDPYLLTIRHHNDGFAGRVIRSNYIGVHNLDLVRFTLVKRDGTRVEDVPLKDTTDADVRDETKYPYS